MRSLLPIALVAMAAAPAFAHDQTIAVTATQHIYKLQPQQMAEIAGVYRLDNGGVFRIKRLGNRLMAQLGERPLTELVAQAEDNFISRDQRMTVDYLPQPFGDLLVLRYPADLAQADAPMVTMRLAVD
ncbi:MAG: hypothetical protein JWP59_461 [Massilia sp.]|nr:hypothetical protein [Massilia sp.]